MRCTSENWDPGQVGVFGVRRLPVLCHRAVHTPGPRPSSEPLGSDSLPSYDSIRPGSAGVGLPVRVAKVYPIDRRDLEPTFVRTPQDLSTSYRTFLQTSPDWTFF